jgi:hypothetical protein
MLGKITRFDKLRNLITEKQLPKYCHVLDCPSRGFIFFGLDIGFIDHLYTKLVTTGNYRAMANLHNLQFTVTHTLSLFQPAMLSLVVAWWRLQQWRFLFPCSSPLCMEVPFQLSTLATDWLPQTVTVITYRHGLHRKHRSSVACSVVAIRTCLFKSQLLNNSSGIFAY